MYMTEDDVLSAIDSEGATANELLCQVDPNFERRYKRITGNLAKLIKEVRQHFPDANYYSGDSGMTLMLGKSHDQNGNPQPELAAAESVGLSDFLSGGGW